MVGNRGIRGKIKIAPMPKRLHSLTQPKSCTCREHITITDKQSSYQPLNQSNPQHSLNPYPYPFIIQSCVFASFGVVSQLTVESTIDNVQYP